MSTSHPRLRNLVRLAALAVLAGCAACGDSAYRGSWEVVGYKRPALSLLGDAEAQIWLGTTFQLTKDMAAVGSDSCTVVEARRQTLSVFELEMFYNLTKGELGLTEPSVEMLDFQCSAGEIPWGQQLILVGSDSLMTSWNRIFLLLERKRGKGP